MGVFDPRPSFRGVTGTERMATAMDMPFSFGQAFGENFAQGALDSFGLGTAIRDMTTPSRVWPEPSDPNLPDEFEHLKQLNEVSLFEGIRNAFEGNDRKALTEDEYKSSPFFRESVPFTPGMTSDRAAALAKFADTRAVRQYFSQKQPIAAFLGQFGGQALDPINYVPVFGQGAQLAAVARFGSIGGRALMSASEAAINTAAFGILTAGVRSRLGDDVSFEMIGTEIAMSALIGGAFGGGIGMLVRGRDARERVALGQARNALSTAANRQKAAIALNEQIDALATTGNPAATPNGMASIETVHTEVQRRVTAARSLDEQTAGVTGTKAGEVVIAPSGRRVSVRPEVVELDSLIHAEGALQVRNRRTAASDAQIEEIAANLDPARMMPNIDGSQGSPLVGSDNIVDSGNGRVAAVRRAYEAYPERAEAYRASLAAEGYDVSTMQRPVLISRRVTELDEAARAQFNAELNGRTTASLGAVEIAQMDRAAMTDSVLDVHAPAPVTAASNRAFVQRFMAELPANDRQALLTEDGKSLSAEGVRRIENALFASAYGDIDPSAVRRFTEGVDDNTRSIVGAMSDMAGAWTKMRRDAKAGVIPAHLDQTRELTDALRLIGMWREQAAREGRPVAKVITEGMAQMDLLSGEIRPEVQVFIRSFYTSDAFTRAQGREALAGQFADLIESGYELGRPSLFGDAMPEVSALQVIENAVRRNAQADPRPTGDALSRAEENGAADIEPAAGADRGLDRQGAATPPPAKGLIRFYHGTAYDSAEGFYDKTFVSPHYEYARDYRGGPNNVLYTDLTKAEAVERGLYDEINNFAINGSIDDGAARLNQYVPVEAVEALAEADIFSHGADLGERPMSGADIADTMRERFENAGRPADEAEAAAGMLSTFYSTMAARTGRSINDLLKIAPLPEVRRGGQPDMSAQALAQAARTATDTPEFRRWFGESKVVGPDGAPLVVYHGTRQDFNAFEPNVRKTEQLGFGVHFAEDEGFAARYAEDDTVARKGKSPRVIPAFLSIQNPLKADRIVREGEPDFELARQIAGSKLFTTKDENGVPSVWLQNAIDAGSPARAQAAIQNAGYDGVEYESRIGSLAPGGRGAYVSGRSRSFIAFEPTQIKSVNNRGTFDPNDPRILYQGPGAPVPPDLYVVHNIKPGGVLNAQKIGGLAMPSLAVTRLGSGDFSSYGSISLIGSPDLIDPKAAKEAKTFNADAYSPRYPSVQYDVDTKAFSDLNKRVVEKAREIGGDEHRGALDPNHIEDRGIESEIDSPGLMRLYLAEKGEVPDVVMREDGKGPDFYGNDDAMKKAIQPQRAEYEEWARAQLAPLVKRERIFKGFDNNGNRRYREHNMENVLADMRSRLREGEGFNYGIGTIRSKHAKQFKSIEAMQKARDKIVPHKGDDIEGTKDEFGDRFFALADEMRPYYKFEANSFQYPDDTAMMFGEVGQKGMRALDEGFKDLPPDLRQKVQEFLADLADAPTEYFETKMQRAVGLGEFQAALVPSDTTPNVRKALEKAGLQVIEYDPKVEGSRVEAVKALNAGRREADPRILFQGARGSIEFGSDGRSVMSMFDAADASTALHESAHWFLQMFRSFADRADAPAEIRADWERVRAWWTENADAVAADSPTGATGDDVRRLMETGTSGNRLVDIGIEVGMQEQWARGFEAYLREGVAPNEGLRGIFDQFKRWLTSIYRQALDLNVNINDDIRGVFDRLLAQQDGSLVPNATKPRPDPVPDGLDAAAAAVRTPPDPMKLGAQYGLDDAGGFAEQADIDALKAQNLIGPEDQAMLDEADQLVADAEAYGRTLETAAWCMR